MRASLRLLTHPAYNSTITASGQETLRSLLASGEWRLTADGTGLQRTFVFRHFDKAMKFWSHVAAESKRQGHHPEWANAYNRVEVRWTTHRPKGLGERDVVMAAFCDKVAEVVGPLRDPAKWTNGEMLLDEMFNSGEKGETGSGESGESR